MSIHKSLRSRNQLKRQRNVYTRIERILQLERESGRSSEESVFGLPKVRVAIVAAPGKKKAKKTQEEEGEETITEGES